MKESDPDPMVPMLTGWLFGNVMSRGGETMKIESACVHPPDAFVVGRWMNHCIRAL